jgi:iron complex transport system ATP-binding protein
MADEVLMINNLDFAYDHRPVLSGISFDVRQGEYLAIIGPNGVGKSTLIKCINRILTGYTGSIHIFGTPLRKFSQRDIARRVGYVPQPGDRTIPFTVREFLLMSRYPYMNPLTSVCDQDRRQIEQVLKETSLEPLADRMVGTLSGGERQIVFIAAAFAQGAEILLLDEPTAFLDYRHQTACHTLLRRLNREFHTTILCVTHDVNHALQTADRLLVLKDGKVFFHGLPAIFCSTGGLESVYETKFACYRNGNDTDCWFVPQGGDA